MGTNGIGTVFEAGQPISVVGPEHFSENLHLFACTGAPVIDPVTGRVEGVLDISTLSSSWSPLMHTLVKSAAKDIGRNFLLDRGQAQRAIFETYLKVVARSARQAVFAFGDSVFVASAAAQQMFDAEEQRIMREHAMFLMAGKDRVSDTITLPGHRLVHVRGTRILAGVEVAGMVVIADLVTRVSLARRMISASSSCLRSRSRRRRHLRSWAACGVRVTPWPAVLRRPGYGHVVICDKRSN